MNVYDDQIIKIAELADFHYEMSMRCAMKMVK